MTKKPLVTALRLILLTDGGNREIGREVGLAHNTIRRYRQIIKEAGIDAAGMEAMPEGQLLALFNKRASTRAGKRIPDWAHIHRELQRKGVTRTLLWMEYKEENPETAYELSRFNELYVEWAGRHAVTMRQRYDPGERGFTDFSGTPIYWVDSSTGEPIRAELFVASAGVSGLLYGRAVPSQRVEHWVDAHCFWYSYLGGVPKITVPDNLKSAVSKCGREPVLNPAYLEMAEHYGTLVLPARPRHPRDKAIVEGGVLVFKRWVIARLRNRQFHSLDELNAAILKCVNEINGRIMRRYGQSRRERFELIDRPAMLPLAKPYEFGEWLGPLRVPPDYHVRVHGHYYSVPYKLTQESISVRCTPRTIEIIHNSTRVASHLRSDILGEKTTDRRHMPEHHLAWADHTPERYMLWATTVGPNALAVVQNLLDNARHPAGALNACSTLQSLCLKHSKTRFELACRKAIEIRSMTVKSVRSILQHKLEQQCEATATTALPSHSNVRGADYYNPAEVNHAE